MLAVVPVRQGEVPMGAADAVAEAGGRLLLVGDGVGLVSDLGASERRGLELGAFAPRRWAQAIAAVVDDDVLVLPGGPDGRVLGPLLAAELGRAYLAGAIACSETEAQVPAYGSAVIRRVHHDGAAVVTLQPGLGLARPPQQPDPELVVVLPVPSAQSRRDAEVLEVSPPDPQTGSLVDADRIFAGGAGLGGADDFARLQRVAGRLGAAMGATRVIADRGWVPFERQIGTTGVAVTPTLYLAFGISGAIQHTAGLGNPDHVIAVNVDAACPMMQRANLAVVADAADTLAALEAALGDADG